jgi:prephenate dehydrogenase
MFERLAIVGFGLMGGSAALAVRGRWPGCRIVAVDRQPVVAAALARGAADAGGEDVSLAADADLVLLAAPVLQNIALLDRLAACVGRHAIVSDVGSTKVAIVEAARHVRPPMRFIGGHPLAGASSAGIESARPDMFDERPWILTPDEHAEPADVARLESFVAALGAAPRTMGPVEHDRLMAYLSHLPQIAVSSLMQVVGDHAGREGLQLAGSGLRDTTRLASSPATTWRDVAATNADAVALAIDDLTAALQRIKVDLRSGQELQRVFDAAKHWKQTLDESGSRPGE